MCVCGVRVCMCVYVCACVLLCVCVCVCVCVCIYIYMLINEDALSQVPGVKYVPLVGKVTVGMLERNLIRLIKQFQLQE